MGLVNHGPQNFSKTTEKVSRAMRGAALLGSSQGGREGIRKGGKSGCKRFNGLMDRAELDNLLMITGFGNISALCNAIYFETGVSMNPKNVHNQFSNPVNKGRLSPSYTALFRMVAKNHRRNRKRYVAG